MRVSVWIRVCGREWWQGHSQQHQQDNQENRARNNEDKEGLQLGNIRVSILKELRRKEKGRQKAGENALISQSTYTDLTFIGDETAAYASDLSAEPGLQSEQSVVQHDDDATILGCLPAPTPNQRHPDAPKNIRSYAKAIANDSWFEPQPTQTVKQLRFNKPPRPRTWPRRPSRVIRSKA